MNFFCTMNIPSTRPPSGALRIVALLTLLVSFLLVTAEPALAKRAEPKPVPPVTAASVTYSAPHDQMGFIVATDATTKKELWRLHVYTVTIDKNLERDVQDVFITTLVLDKGLLTVTNERGERFSVDPATRKVTKMK